MGELFLFCKHTSNLLQLNDNGEIELTEIGPDDPQVSNNYQYPNMDNDETDRMIMSKSHASTNNNHADYRVSIADTTPRQRRQSGFTVRGTNPRNKRVWVNIRQRAKDIKSRIPEVKDVNNIDKYSRLMFPLLFVIFNAWYWAYYSILSREVSH